MTQRFAHNSILIGYLKVERNLSPDVLLLKEQASVVNCTEALNGVRFLFNREAINWYSLRLLVNI
jgi:hypothetical protein